MIDSPFEGDVSAVATVSDAGETGTIDSTVTDELSEVAPPETASDTSSPQEQSTQEAKPDDPAESKDLKTVRDWGRSLEKDLRPLKAGIETTAKELYGTNNPEDIQAAMQTIQALAPSIKVLTDPNAAQADVVSTLQRMLPPEHVEALVWAGLNDPRSHEFIFSDPEVLQTISERLFDGRSIEDVQNVLANATETDFDPATTELRKELASIRAEKAREISEKQTMASQKASEDLLSRFFEAPAQTVIAEDFKLVAPEGASEADKQLFADTAEDIRYAAQGRFLKANMDAYMQIDSLYRKGMVVQAQAAEIRLANRYHATLIKTAERHANLLKSRSVATVNGQQAKINGVRPDVTGSVEQGEKPVERWDIDAPDFAQKFAASFHN